MPTVDRGPAPIAGKTPSGALVYSGASVPIIIRSLFGHQISVNALIDTGSELTCVDENLIGTWQLNPIDFQTVPGSQSLAPVYALELEIPALSIRALIGVASRNLQDPAALLGRAQLSDCVLVYDGPQGRVQLRR